MNKLKTYKEFSVNEELNNAFLLPMVLVSNVGKKLFSIYPLLNTKWNEIKTKTKDSDFESLLVNGRSSKINCDIEKIEKTKLPKSLKFGTLLRKWNIYLTSEGALDLTGVKTDRPLIYISKDELSKGDTCIFERLSDIDVYPEKTKIIKQGAKIEDPVIMMVAKFEDAETFSELENSIKDVWLEIKDDYPFEVKPNFNLQGDYISIDINLNQHVIKINKGLSNLRRERLIKMIEELSERTKDFLEYEGFNFDYEIKFELGGNLIYTGNKGRFGKEIIPLAKEYLKSPIHVNRNTGVITHKKEIYSPGYKMLRVDLLGLKSKMALGIDDLETLLSDMDNCYDTNDEYWVEVRPEEVKSKGLIIKNILVRFKKKLK